MRASERMRLGNSVSDEGILYRRTGKREQLVLPKEYRPVAFRELHQEMGHLGVDRTLDLIRDRFYWPRMHKDTEHFVTSECECLKRKKPNRPTRAPLVPVQTTHPFQLVSVDFLHLETCKQGYEYILVVMDHFTRFAQAYATKTKSAKAVVECLFNDFVLKFGFPEKIHHDLGREFENQLFAELQKVSGVRGSHTTPYHPMGNGQVERFNRTLLSMLRTLDDNKKADWRRSLPKVVHAYNCTRSEATGFSPYFLLFGRSPRLPIDLMFNLPCNEKQQSHANYVADWRARMQDAYVIASKTAEKEAGRGKRYYDRKAHGVDLQIGGRVLIRNLSERGGPGKLRSHWENTVYKVVNKKSPDCPVYEVMPEMGGKIRTVHRNLLLPCDSLPVEEPPLIKQHRNQKRTKTPGMNRQQRQLSDVDTDSDNEDEEYTLTYQPTLPSSGTGRPTISHAEAGPSEYMPVVNEHPGEGEFFEPETVDDSLQLEWLTEVAEEDESEPERARVEDSGLEQEIEDNALEEESDYEDVPQSPQRPAYPQRERRQPKMLTYEQFGEPTVISRNTAVKGIGLTPPSCRQFLWRPWVFERH